MLVTRGRLDPGMELATFFDDMIRVRKLQVIPITAAIAIMAQSERFAHGDPADRLIAATAICHHATLLTADRHLHGIEALNAVW